MSSRKKRKANDQTQNLIRAFNHPMRREIVGLLRERPGGTSPKEASALWTQPLSNVSYHFRVLAGAGAISCVRTKRIRGSIAHYYVVKPSVLGLPLVAALLPPATAAL